MISKSGNEYFSKILETYISGIESYLLLIFLPIISKLVSTLNNTDQFKRCGISYGLPFNLLKAFKC